MTGADPTVADPDTAVAVIPDGATVGLGGAVNGGHPMALIRALIRRAPRSLDLVALMGGLDLDLLVAAGCAASVSAAYVGAAEIVGLPPMVRWAAESGRLEVHESEEGIHLASLRARAQNLPYATWTGALGTSPAAHHPLVEEAVDPGSGASYLKVRPQRVDVALLWAEAADTDGNVLLWELGDFGDETLRNAADLRIVQVERIVPTAELLRTPDRVSPWSADRVVRAPLSTHPFAGSGLRVDDAWLRQYADTIRRARTGDDPDAVRTFLDHWVHTVDDEAAYLERVGVGRLLELMP